MRILSKAACRVDLAGGTLDIWPLYLYHANAVTVNFAITCHASCMLETRADRRIVLRSRDQQGEEAFESLDALRAAKRYKLPLPAFLLRFFTPACGLTIETDSESPMGGGIAGSSTLIIAIASALDRFTGGRRKLEELRLTCQNIEAQIIGVPTGAQDYYPAMYGGLNAIELASDGIHRKEIPVDPEELNRRFVLAYTGKPRQSGINNWEVMKAYIDGDRRIRRNFDYIAAIAHAMRLALERGDWETAGRLLREEWDHRRRNAPGITTAFIDHLVKVTRPAGAVGAKACGAGGGGCVLFLVEPDARAAVSRVIEREGGQVLPVRLETRGVRVRVVSQ